MRLDVGCGNAPTGDVNVDLPGSERHREGVKIIAKKIPNFVYASAYFLPFRDNCFDEVVSFHLLEHLETPILVLKENGARFKGRCVYCCSSLWISR